jgi:hypothetical protein
MPLTLPQPLILALSVYWWNGASQLAPVETRWYASISNGEEFRNLTDGWVVQQVDCGTQVSLRALLFLWRLSCPTSQPHPEPSEPPDFPRI